LGYDSDTTQRRPERKRSNVTFAEGNSNIPMESAYRILSF